MKKIYGWLLVIAVTGTIGLISCKKNIDSTKNQVTIEATPADPGKDEVFQKLNSSISRFDPKYLQLVYKDKRSTEDITKESLLLLQELGNDPNNIGIQQKLAAFYHFRSVDELKQVSADISSSLQAVDKKYHLQQGLSDGTATRIFSQARKQWAKDRLDNYPNNGRQTSGLWTDFVDTYFSEFDYNTYIYDQELAPALDGGGGDNGCNGEKCCIDRYVCLAEAKNKFWSDLITYGGGMAVGAGTTAGGIGFKAAILAGSPEFAMFSMAFFGGFGFAAGGSLGASIAYNIYSTNKDICNAKYDACIKEKK